VATADELLGITAPARQTADDLLGAPSSGSGQTAEAMLGITAEPSAMAQFFEPTVRTGQRIVERLRESGEAVLGLPSLIRKFALGEAQGGLSDVVKGTAKPVTATDVGWTALRAVGAPFEPIFAPIGESIRTAAEGFVSPETAKTVGAVGEMAAGVGLPFVRVPATPVTRGLSRVGLGRLHEETLALDRARATKPVAEVLREPVPPTEIMPPPGPSVPGITDVARDFRSLQAEGQQLAEQIGTLERAGLPVPRQLRQAYEDIRLAMRGPEARPAMPEVLRRVVQPRAPEAAPAISAAAPETALTGGAPVIGEPLLTPRVSEEATRAITTAAKNTAEALGQTQASAEGKRLFRQVAEALSSGQIHVPDLPQVLERSGLSLPEFVREYADTVSASGRQLQQLSALRQHLDRIASSDPQAARALAELTKHLPPTTLWQMFLYGAGRWPGFVAIDNFRRASLVAQTATTARNILSQTGRYTLEVLDQALQGGIKGEGMGNAPELLASFFRNFPGRQTAELTRALEAFPLDAAKLSALPAGEVNLGTKWTRVINTLNSMQESFFRRAIFDATIRGELRQRGLDVATTLANPRTIPADIITTATQRALESTFAATPGKGTFGDAVMRMYQAFPPLTTINPFPRFLMNSYKFLLDFSPAGYLRLLGKTPEGVLNLANAGKRAEILSRASLGTGLLASGLAVRYSDLAGPKWYEIQVGDKTLDARPFAPVSTYLFFGEALKIMGEAGADSIRNGTDLLQALKTHGKMTVQDVAQGLLSINRIAGTGLVAVDLIRSGAMERKLDLLRDFLAQYLGGFSVPLRTLKDALAGGSPEEATMRDVRGTLLGPAKANVPILSQELPPRPSPLRADIPQVETPWLRQTTGLSLRTKTPVEAEVDRLGIEFPTIAPRTGDPEADRLIAGKMGILSERIVTRILQGPQYQALPDPQKEAILRNLFGRIGTAARQQAAAERPDVFAPLRLQNLPVWKRLLIPDVIRKALDAQRGQGR